MKFKLVTLVFFISGMVSAQERPYDVHVFSNSRMEGPYFFTQVKTEGESTVTSTGNKIPVSTEFFHTPGNSLKFEYTDAGSGNWEVLLQRPRIRGQDIIIKPTVLSFWVFVPSTSVIPVTSPQLKLLIRTGRRDSSYSETASFRITKKGVWEQVLIPVTAFGSIDTGRTATIVGLVFSQGAKDGGKHLFYIDDVEMTRDVKKGAVPSKPTIASATGYAKHIDLTWSPVTDTNVKFVKVYRSTDNKNFKPVGVQRWYTSRYADYTGETGKKYFYRISLLNQEYQESAQSGIVSASTREMSDDELLTMVQEASFRYYWDGAEKISGMALENIAGRHNMIATGASGFGIMAIIAGTERGFITRGQLTDRLLQIVRFLEKADKFHGVVPHFIDGPTGKAEAHFGPRDNGGDLVEHSFLMQGLLAARAYFNRDNTKEKEIREKITALWTGTEWDWYRRDPDSKFLYWHWSPDQDWVINHRLIGWNETMVTYLLAIASPSHAIPASMYYTGWASQDSIARAYRTNWGGTTEGSTYSNENTYFDIKLDVGVSSGGPLFFTHYSYMGYDPHAITDKYTNYFDNNRNIALINYRYCVANPGKYQGYGDSAWGLTACDGPFGYAPDEPVLRQDRGKIAPTGAISSFPYTPEESMKALKNYYLNLGNFLWGEYGFRDAFNRSLNWTSEYYMGLNQAPMTVMIENYRTGLIWKLLMSDPDVQAGLKKLEAEK